jgi:hypothetical protein
MNENEMRFSRPPETEPAPSEKKNFFARFKFFNFKKALKVLVIVVILLAVVFVVFLGKDFVSGLFKAKNDVYSAVFLSNGQVYFGKMTKNNESEIVLSNVFYIQVNDKAQAGGSAGALNQTSFNLVKLGNELHGPTDELFINKLQVVFYEKLRDDSKVVESIKNYK